MNSCFSAGRESNDKNKAQRRAHTKTSRGKLKRKWAKAAPRRHQLLPASLPAVVISGRVEKRKVESARVANGKWGEENPASCVLVWAQWMKMKIAQMKMSVVTLPVFGRGQKHVLPASKLRKQRVPENKRESGKIIPHWTELIAVKRCWYNL